VPTINRNHQLEQLPSEKRKMKTLAARNMDNSLRGQEKHMEQLFYGNAAITQYYFSHLIVLA
jgi:hypothetical protein